MTSNEPYAHDHALPREPMPPASRPFLKRNSLIFAVLCLAIVTAFRAILVEPFGLTDPGEFEYWFFIPNRDSGAISVLIAAWFLWNRRRHFCEESKNRIGWLHWIVVIAILAAFFWAIWSSTQSLLVPILCATIATLAFAFGGRPALRLIVMPCAALMLAFPPPAPLQAEIIWRLQNWTAAGSHLILSLAGYSSQLEGVEVRFGGHAFVLIEACSGWRGIQILWIVALAASELREIPFRRMLWVVFAAIPLGIVLNVMRACLVMLTQEELKVEIFESHTPQGIAVLMIGGIVLYGVATLVQGRRHSASRIDDATARPDSRADDQTPGVSSIWPSFGITFSLLLAAISVLIPALSETPGPPDRDRFKLPTEMKHWTGTELGLDYFFPYSTPANRQFHVDYRNPDAPGGARLVDLFIAWETPKPSGLDRMPDSKLLLPASDWTVVSHESAPVWQLEFDADRAIVARDDRSKFSYVIAWRVRDRGLLQESLLSLLGLRGCGDSRYGCPRVVVRVAVPVFIDDDDGRERARETASEFIDDFILPLKVLAIR